jgi:outer membrane protein assembly factor BamC
MNLISSFTRAAVALVAIAAFALSGCESTSLGKRIDYKSQSTGAPSLEIPPDLSTPKYDDRYAITSASGMAAKAGQPVKSEILAVNTEAWVARGGQQRWLVVKTTPEQAWAITRQFWLDTGFVLAVEQPAIGVMETDWAENRADAPNSWLTRTLPAVSGVFYNTYKRDKFHTRIERGVEAGTVEIYVSHRGMEQMPTKLLNNAVPVDFAWAVVPPNPDLEAEILSRLMMRFGVAEPQAVAATAPNAPASSSTPDRARLEKTGDGSAKLLIDDPFDRAWRRVGLALDRSGFTVVDRDRQNGVYFVRYSDPDAQMQKKDKDESWIQKLMFWKKDDKEKVENYRIKIAEAQQQSVVSVQDTNGSPDKSQTSERILALLKDQLK